MPPQPAADVIFQFQQATALHKSGQIPQAQALYEDILKKQPRHAEALYRLGVIAYQMNDHAKAAQFFSKAVKAAPEVSAFHSNLGFALQGQERFREAVDSFSRAVKLAPEVARSYVNRSGALYDLGEWDAALLDGDKAVALDPREPGGHYTRGNALQKLKRNEDAIASYAAVLALAPNYGAAYVNRGNALQELGRLEEAIADYDRAITLTPSIAIIYANRAVAYQKLERRDEAAADFARALTIDPTDLESKKNLFWFHFSHLKDLSLVESLSGELAALTRARDVRKLQAMKVITDFRLLHDLEQSDYLLAEGYETEGLKEANAVMRKLHERHEGKAGRKSSAGSKIIHLSTSEVETLATYRNGTLRYGDGTTLAACLDPNRDWAAVEEQYLAASPEIVVIDDFLLPEALAALRKFCLVSTVWRTDYDANEYLGAFPEDGFVGLVHFQLAMELRARMPRIFGAHALEQLWGFKYAQRLGKGINVHADFARVNLNFWITPDEANLDATSGGMVIYDAPAPQDWNFLDYNFHQEKIYGFLEEKKSGSRTVPYRCNRAVLFNSNLFHKTDAIRFKEGYGNRRINITYLFGRGLKFP